MPPPKRQRTSPTTTMQRHSSSSTPNHTTITAAIRIQCVWRRKFSKELTHSIAAEFLKPSVGVTKDFEQLVIYLRDKTVVAATRRCLMRVQILADRRHGSPRLALAPVNVNVRVFLAGFMIAFRPTHVFESMGSLEQALYEATIPMLAKFQSIVQHLARGTSFQDVDLSRDFTTMLYEYLRRFKEWKVPDERKLTCRIKHALIALYQAEDHLPPDEPKDSKLKIEFRTQIERLRSKLQQIAGPDELTAFDDKRAASPPGAACGGGAYTDLPGRMTNEQLAHELLLEPAFQLDESGGSEVENPVFHRIRQSFHQAFWDSLADDLRLHPNPCFVRVLRVLVEIRDGITDLAGDRECVKDAIDVDFIRQQIDLGAYDWDSCRRLVGNTVAIIRRVQAPKRDDETARLWKAVGTTMLAAQANDRPDIMCKALAFLLDRLNVMRIDAANARLRLVSPVIKDHGIDYERNKFQDKLNDGTLTLERTQAWINATVQRETTAGGLVSLEDLHAGKAYSTLHAAAIFALVAANTPVTALTVPETLLMDVSRLALLHREFHRIVDGVTILATANHAIKHPSPEQRFALIDLTRRLVDGTDPLDAIVADFCAKENCPSTLLATLQSSIGNREDSVRRLIALRVSAVWIDHMRTFCPISDTKFLAIARPLIPSIHAAAAKLAALANMNRTVHAPTYNTVIPKAVAART